MEFPKKQKILICAAFSFFSALFFALPTFAEGGVIEISPVVKEVQLSPGVTYSDTMEVRNVGDETLTFSVSVSPYQVNNGDYSPVYTVDNNWTQITKWISVPSGIFSVEPGESANVDYTISVPLDVPAGGQYATISAVSDDGTKNENAIKIVSSVGMVISAEVDGETRSSGEILSKDIQGFLLQPPISATFSLSNTGNINATASCTMKITNFINGSEVYSNADSPKRVVVLPDTVRNSEVSWPDSPYLGIFRVALSLEYLNDTANFSKIVILCPLWFIVLFFVAIVGIIIFIIIRVKKRRPHYKKKKFNFK